MTRSAPEPLRIRESSLAELRRLGLPLPPPHFPLVWERGDTVVLRSSGEIEARVAILNVVLACSFGMPARLAMAWLVDARLVDRLTAPEWRFVAAREGDRSSFALHLEALFALSWVLGIARDLDPLRPAADGLVYRLPNLIEGESFASWRSRVLAAPREPGDAAALLDLYYCLDWSYLESERRGEPLPGMIDSNAIGQRRWALEWAVVFSGPFHDPPVGWEEVDLSV